MTDLHLKCSQLLYLHESDQAETFFSAFFSKVSSSPNISNSPDPTVRLSSMCYPYKRLLTIESRVRVLLCVKHRQPQFDSYIAPLHPGYLGACQITQAFISRLNLVSCLDYSK